MGRKAKNKQPPPAPFPVASEGGAAGAARNGKRKASTSTSSGPSRAVSAGKGSIQNKARKSAGADESFDRKNKRVKRAADDVDVEATITSPMAAANGKAGILKNSKGKGKGKAAPTLPSRDKERASLFADKDDDAEEEQGDEAFGELNADDLQAAIDREMGDGSAEEEEEDDEDDEELDFEDEDQLDFDEDDDEVSGSEEEQQDASNTKPKSILRSSTTKASAKSDAPTKLKDEQQEQALLSQLDFQLPPPGAKLSERQKKKARVEMERLELLLKSAGHSLDDGEEEGVDEEEEEDDDDEEEELNEEELAFLDGDGGDDADELDVASDEDAGEEEQDEFDLSEGDEDEDEDDEDEEGDEEDDETMLPTLADADKNLDSLQGTDLKVVQMRMQEIVAILTNWKSFRHDQAANLAGDSDEDSEDEEMADGKMSGKKQLLKLAAGKSRADYVDQLLEDICAYFGYNRFLAEKLFNLFTPAEVSVLPSFLPDSYGS